MKQLREHLVKKILNAKNEDEVESLVINTIALLRDHMVSELIIAQFMDKMIIELQNSNSLNNDILLLKIRLLHPTGLQWHRSFYT